jgi:hypothetical protein
VSTTSVPRTRAPAAPPPVLPWQPASVAVLRLAGFPFSWLDRLADPAVGAAARRRTDAGQALAALGVADLRTRAPGLGPDRRRPREAVAA